MCLRSTDAQLVISLLSLCVGATGATALSEDALKVVVISASGGGSSALAEAGSLWAWGNSGLTRVQPRNSPLKISGPQQFGRFAAGSEHTLGIKADGTL